MAEENISSKSPDNLENVLDENGDRTLSVQDWLPIDLAWRQKLSAYWSIFWPAGLASALVSTFCFSYISEENLSRYSIALNLVANMVLFIVQALLIQRLVRKLYRSFRIELERPNGTGPAGFTNSEIMLFASRLLWPQIAFYLAALGMSAFGSFAFSPEIASGLAALLSLLRLPIVGPYALGWAVNADYPGFRLQPYGIRFV